MEGLPARYDLPSSSGQHLELRRTGDGWELIESGNSLTSMDIKMQEFFDHHLTGAPPAELDEERHSDAEEGPGSDGAQEDGDHD